MQRVASGLLFTAGVSTTEIVSLEAAGAGVATGTSAITGINSSVGSGIWGSRTNSEH